MYERIRQTFEEVNHEDIPLERRQMLHRLADRIAAMTMDGTANINFICTHNSRRSHLSQIWCQAAASYYGVQSVVTYSGGTEATAMYPMIGTVLEMHGWKVSVLAQRDNPVYRVSYDDNALPLIIFSKRYDDAYNPKDGYIAVMTCHSADESCPTVSGAAERIAVTYEDPKVSDGTPHQESVYLQRSLQIATEMSYTMKSVSKLQQKKINQYEDGI